MSILAGYRPLFHFLQFKFTLPLKDNVTLNHFLSSVYTYSTQFPAIMNSPDSVL